MILRGSKLLPAVAAMAAIGMMAGVGVYVALPGGQEEVVSQVEVPGSGIVSPVDCVPEGISILAPTPIDPAAPKFIPVNPEAGLTDSERLALHEQARQAFKRNYASWVECVSMILNKIDLRSVPTYAINISFAPGQPALPDAVAKAELIVVGNVIRFSPMPRGGTLTTLAVEHTLKGSPISTLTYMQGSQISPTEDWTGVTISEAPNEGLLVLGDRAILLLQQDTEGVYHVQNVSGWFRVVDGIVKANYYNDWGASVGGKTEAEFVELLKAAVAESAALQP